MCEETAGNVIAYRSAQNSRCIEIKVMVVCEKNFLHRLQGKSVNER